MGCPYMYLLTEDKNCPVHAAILMPAMYSTFISFNTMKIVMLQIWNPPDQVFFIPKELIQGIPAYPIL